MDEMPNRWLDKAISENDKFDRFIAAYIAMNYLYGGREEPKERDRFINCAVQICEEHDICPFKFNHAEYLKGPILDMRPGNNKKSVEVNPCDMCSLFSAIYQVRCNLFHGNKNICNDRDSKLVEQGAEILIKILRMEHTGCCCKLADRS